MALGEYFKRFGLEEVDNSGGKQSAESELQSECIKQASKDGNIYKETRRRSFALENARVKDVTPENDAA